MKHSILFLVAAWLLAVTGLADVNLSGLANVDVHGSGADLDVVDGELPVVDYGLEARAEISTVTITDYDCDETSAPPKQPSSPTVTPAAPVKSTATVEAPPAAPTEAHPVPTTFIITVAQPPATPETHASSTSPVEHSTTAGPSGGEVSVTVSACPGCPSAAPSSTGHPESPGSSGVGVSVTVSLCEGCPSSATSSAASPVTSSDKQSTSQAPTSESIPTVATASSSKSTPSATPVPNDATPLKGMPLAGLALAALHLVM